MLRHSSVAEFFKRNQEEEIDQIIADLKANAERIIDLSN